MAYPLFIENAIDQYYKDGKIRPGCLPSIISLPDMPFSPVSGSVLTTFHADLITLTIISRKIVSRKFALLQRNIHKLIPVDHTTGPVDALLVNLQTPKLDRF